MKYILTSILLYYVALMLLFLYVRHEISILTPKEEAKEWIEGINKKLDILIERKRKCF